MERFAVVPITDEGFPASNIQVSNLDTRQDAAEYARSFGFTVFDAFENVQRAWMQVNVLSNKDPYVCHIKPLGQKDIYCKTEDEFNALIMKHFGIERP